ncbi:MAG: DnaA/Hda family protein [Pirellulales bacterium]
MGLSADPLRGAALRKNPRWFLAGPENHLAAAALNGVLQALAADAAAQPGRLPPGPLAVSPLVLHGPPGTGKSHLAHGLAEQWRSGRPRDGVLCLAASEMASEFAEAIERRAIDAWRWRLRSADLLVLENLGNIAAKTAVQIELLHTLDALAERGAQVVVTSRLPPLQIKTLLPALASRLCEGLQVPLSLPGPLARYELVRQLAGGRNIDLAESAARVMADALATSVPELWGFLLQLETSAREADGCQSAGNGAAGNGAAGNGAAGNGALPPSADRGPHVDAILVRRYLFARTGALRPTVGRIAVQTARYYALKLADLKGTSRRRGVVLARDVAMYLSRQLTPGSLAKIGDYFGGRDHTTVQHGCRKVDALARTDPGTRQAIDSLRQTLAGG